MPNAYEVNQQSAELIAASITHSTAATADTLMTFTRRRQLLTLASSLDVAVIATYNGQFLGYIGSSGNVVLDVGADGNYFEVDKVIGVYYVSGSPTTGSLYGLAI